MKYHKFKRKPSMPPLTPEEEMARLRSEVVRLRAEVRGLKKELNGREQEVAPPAMMPAFPAPDSDGNYPAAEALRTILARQIIRRRQQAGWTQAELAERAGVRQETVSRIESGKNAPNVGTVDKLDRALREAGA
ncbi:MAG TPA: helix-turn-helix domain-containing protein [Gemmataceae bacterium]|nr:helix-turn-helix domain-containing protein [Gemmataceae bacterium]